MKMLLLAVGLILVSLGGSLSVNHFPYDLIPSIFGGVMIGLGGYWESK
jgi:hypothetical protein